MESELVGLQSKKQHGTLVQEKEDKCFQLKYKNIKQMDENFTAHGKRTIDKAYT